ncbi:MAG: hypothetical protein Q9P14_07350 [candidate division KSB1 bacterium]|nr:hypothetical protein [candidate division KSB1 bacterium]
MSDVVPSAFVTDWLEKRAQLTPERVAIEDVTGETVLTYRDWEPPREPHRAFSAAPRRAKRRPRLGVCQQLHRIP